MGSLFTPNGEINVSKSPFSSFFNERMIYDGRIDDISIEHIMMSVKRGFVFGVDFIILEAISELEFATSRMITIYLLLKNIEIEQSKVSRRLKLMKKKKIISRFKFVSDEGNPSVRAYCLEKAGKYLLMSRNYMCKWKQSHNTRPIDMTKEILARNQVLLNYRNHVNDRIDKYIINPVFKLKKSSEIFKPHLQINFTEKYGNEILLFDVIRSYEGYKEKAVTRLRKFQEFYKYFAPTQDMPKIPKLILIGELDKHLFEILKVTIKEKLQLNNMEYLYTTDLRVIDEKLHKSIFKFDILKEEEKNTVKIKELNFPILQ